MRFFSRQRSRSRVQSVIVYLLLISVTLFLLVVVGYEWVSHSVTNYAAQSYQASLDSMVRLFDQEVNHLETMANQLSQMSWVRRIMFMQEETIDRDRVSDYSLYEYQQQIKTIMQTSPLINEVGIVFMQKDLVLASYGKSNIEFLACNAVQVEGLNTKDWREMGNRLSFSQFLLFDNVTINKYKVSNTGTLFVIPLHDGTTSRVSALLFVVIHHQSLCHYVQPFIQSIGGNEPTLKIYQKNSKMPFLSYGTQTPKKIRALKSISTKTGWLYVTEIPESLVVTDAVKIRNILTSISAGIWLIGIISLLTINYRFFKPIESIMEMFSTNDDAGKHFINEFDAIKRNIAQLQQQSEKMKNELLQRRPMARSAAFAALMKQKPANEQELCKVLSVLDLDSSWQQYCVCFLLPIYGEEGQEPDLQKLEDLYKEPHDNLVGVVGCMNIIPTILLCVQDEQTLKEGIATLLGWFPKCCIIMGEIVDSACQIHISYQTAQDARNYRIVSEGFRLLRYDNTLLSKGGYYFPQDMEYTLLQAIRNGTPEKALEIFENLYQHNVSKCMVTHAGANNLLNNIYLSIIKLLHEDNLVSTCTQWPKEGSLDEMKVYVNVVIMEAAEQYKKKLLAMPDQLEDIISYILSNLFNSDLSLTMVSDAFGISNSQVSRLFSQFHRENFLSFVNRHRIDAACELLAHDYQIDILTIAKSVGYDNDVTFRRLFKKYVGMTPTQYRDQRLNTITEITN